MNKKEPYGIVLQEVLKSDKLTMKSKLVYSMLTTYVNGKGGKCWPSITKLTSDLGISRPTVINGIKELINAGIITRETGKNNRNEYILSSKEFLPLSSKESLPLDDQVVKNIDPSSKEFLPLSSKEFLPEHSHIKNTQEHKKIQVSKPTHTPSKNLFYEFYEKHFGVSFKGWGPKDAKNLDLLIEKLEKHLTEISAPGDFLPNFEALLHKAAQDNWIKNRFSIPIINMKFDEIVKPEYSELEDFERRVNEGML